MSEHDTAFMRRKWSVLVENDVQTARRDAMVEALDADDPLRELVMAAPGSFQTATLVDETGAWVLPRQFSPACAEVLGHIAELHNASLDGALREAVEILREIRDDGWIVRGNSRRIDALLNGFDPARPSSLGGES